MPLIKYTLNLSLPMKPGQKERYAKAVLLGQRIYLNSQAIMSKISEAYRKEIQGLIVTLKRNSTILSTIWVRV